MERGFRYGESEYEVSFGLAHRNGEVSTSDPKTHELLILRSGAGTRNALQIQLPAKFGSRYIIYPEIKGQGLFLWGNGQVRNYFLTCLLL